MMRISAASFAVSIEVFAIAHPSVWMSRQYTPRLIGQPRIVYFYGFTQNSFPARFPTALLGV
jgi:hypothetical protein